MQEEQPTAFLSSFFSPRNIIFLLMGLATAAFVLQRAGGERLPGKATERLESHQYRVMVRVLVDQVALVRMNPAGRGQDTQALIRNLNLLDTRGNFFQGPRQLDRLILLHYLGEKQIPQPLPELQSAPGYGDYVQFFAHGKVIEESSPLLSGATKDAMRVLLLRRRKADFAADQLESQMRLRMLATGAVVMAVLGSMFVLYMIALGIVLFRKPARRFPVVRRLFLPETQRASLEAFLIHLFLSVPVLGFAAGFVPAEQRLAVAAAGLLLSFAIAIGYFWREAGSHQLRMIVHAESLAALPKEVFIGFLGFAVIFPGAVAVLLFTVAAFEPEAGVRAAHPLVFELDRSFWLPLFLAGLVAPVVEEVMFRGFLYGFMRNFFAGMGSALLTGLVFALLHPQGVVALPYLTVLGAGLAVLREMRPSLIAPMTVHAIINTGAIVAASWLLKA